MNKVVITIKYEIPTGDFCSYPDRKTYELSICEYLDNHDMKCEVFNTSIYYSRENSDYEKCGQCLNALKGVL